jgi:hypothetical protein
LGFSSIYVAPNAPFQNHYPAAPTIAVQVANGTLALSIASEQLALVTDMPNVHMTGHIMKEFPHMLIGLGPFVDADCYVTFTKTNFTAYDKNHLVVLKGWGEPTSSKLWQWPLLSKSPSTPTSLDKAIPTTTTTPPSQLEAIEAIQPPYRPLHQSKP